MGWTVRESNSVGGEIFRTCPYRPCGPPIFLNKGYRVFPRGKERPERDEPPHPFYCRGQERVQLYLYSPYGPYSLYSTSVPVQRCTLPLPIPLLPLWAVQPVQSLSACTTVHFTFTYTSTPPMGRMAYTEPQCLYNGALYLYLYLYSPYGPYSLYRASVPVQRCTVPLPFFTNINSVQCIYSVFFTNLTPWRHSDWLTLISPHTGQSLFLACSLSATTRLHNFLPLVI